MSKADSGDGDDSEEKAEEKAADFNGLTPVSEAFLTFDSSKPTPSSSSSAKPAEEKKKNGKNGMAAAAAAESKSKSEAPSKQSVSPGENKQPQPQLKPQPQKIKKKLPPVKKDVEAAEAEAAANGDVAYTSWMDKSKEDLSTLTWQELAQRMKEPEDPSRTSR